MWRRAGLHLRLQQRPSIDFQPATHSAAVSAAWHSVRSKPVACCMAQELEGNFSFQSSWRQTYLQAKLHLQGVATPQKVGLSVIDSGAALALSRQCCLANAQALEARCHAAVCTSPAASSLYAAVHHLPGTETPDKVWICQHDHQQDAMQMPCVSSEVQQAPQQVPNETLNRGN